MAFEPSQKCFMRGIFHIVNLYKLKFNEKTDDPGIKRDDPPVKRDNPPVKKDDPFVKTDYLYEIFKKIFPANQNRAFKFEKIIPLIILISAVFTIKSSFYQKMIV